MKPHQIAIQYYTLWDFTKTPNDIAFTPKKVREIGFGSVPAGIMSPIEAEGFLKILAGERLTLGATHEAADVILDEPERVVERLGRLNCKYTAYPHPKDNDLGSGFGIKE